MSRGPGRWQRAILDALESRPLLLPLSDYFRPALASRSDYRALLRAAHSLEAAGRCDLLRLWSDDGPDRRLVLCACRPGHVLKDGRPAKTVSVERVPGEGTQSTFKGSLRQLARQERVSVTTVRRDLKRAAAAREGV
jgi:hypothetical protein